MPDSPEPGADGPVRPGRSVFDEPPPGRRVLDGAAFGVYEDITPPSRWPKILGGALTVLVVVVGVLVWRAVVTDADLALPARDSSSTTSLPPGAVAPTIGDLEALIPAGLGTCAAPADPPEAGVPRVAVICPREGVPEFVVFVLYATVEDRAAEFEAVVDDLGVAADATDCVLGQNGVHDYIGFERVGRLACFASGGIVDFVWTSDEAPLLVRARGPGSFVDHYAFWDRIVERTDAGFPLPSEQALLDALPGATVDACRRDLDLNVAAAGSAAVLCDPAVDVVDVVSSVQFGDAEAMNAWIDEERARASDNVFSERPDACTSSGFGRRPPPPTSSSTTPPPQEPGAAPDATPTTTTTTTTVPLGPVPDAGFTRYDRDGTTGRILCRTDGDGVHRLSWIRDGSSIGSVAVSDGGPGVTMAQLLAWWQEGGHRP